MKIRRKFTSEQKTKIVLAVISKESTMLEMSKKEDIRPVAQLYPTQLAPPVDRFFL